MITKTDAKTHGGWGRGVVEPANTYHKIPKISPSKYKPPKTGNAKKTLR